MRQIIITGLSGSEKGRTYEFDASTVLLGSGQNCDISFDSRWDRTVDVAHARLVWKEGRLWLEDAGSRNGVYLDGRKVSREMLGPESVIELGRNGPRLKIEAPDATPGKANFRRGKSKTRKFAWQASLVLFPLFFLVSAKLIIPMNFGTINYFGGDSDSRLKTMANRHREAVGLVVCAGGGEAYGLGTCWAIREDLYVTNAHLAVHVREVLRQGGGAFVIVNERADLRFRIAEAIIHPDFGKELVNAEGKTPEVGAYDVALLRIEGSAPKVWKIADRAKLETLASGYRIAFLGFPMELLLGNGVNRENPVANMQSGIITSTTDFWLGKSHYEERLLINHNLPATGGASGSPLFDKDGEVVGVLFGVNVITDFEIDPETKTIKARRIPNPAQVNFGQRVSLVNDLLKLAE